MYQEEDRARIIAAGGDTFKKLVAEAPDQENVRTWLAGVQMCTGGFVLTEDKIWITRLASLYRNLAAARD